VAQQQPDFSAYEASVAAVRAQMVAYAASVWTSGDFTDAGMARLVQFMVPKVRAGQMRVANLTSAYFARATGTQPLPVTSAVTEGRGIPPEVEYQRPIITTRTVISRAKSKADQPEAPQPEVIAPTEKAKPTEEAKTSEQAKPVEKPRDIVQEAKDAGGRRLESLVTTDLQMAKVRQADLSLEHAGVTYYRRVPKGTHTCALCLIASTQKYKTGKLMALHPGCDCGVDVLPNGEDLDDVIDEALLLATHQKVKEFAGISDRGGRKVDYRKLLVEHDHGELGAVLGWRDQKFTSAKQIPSISELPPVQLDA
jgi:hypothetical protein